MRRLLASLLVLISIIVIIIPTLLVRGCTIGESESKRPQGSVIKVFNHYEQIVKDMDLEEYVKGVVAAEMPASFEMEALKAQAVLARTYVIRRLQRGYSIPEYPGVVISTDYQTGQAWASKEELQEKWGILNYLVNWNKISRAVELTAGQVLVYGNELIEALYHSNAGGQTEDAAFVWGNAVPYLKSVDSKYDSEASNFQHEFNFTWRDLDRFLNTNINATVQQTQPVETRSLIGGDDSLIEILEVSPTNRILQLRVGTQIISGRDLRSKLGLSSTLFEIAYTPQGLKFTTYGNGHGVGMSQYGANGLAKNGAKYHEILMHYYPGTYLGRLQ